MTNETENNKAYLVIEVINSSTIVVNAGRMDGVERGYKCRISAPERTIIDPSTGSYLGTLQLEKGSGIVTQAYEKFCVVRSFKGPLQHISMLMVSGAELEYAPFSEQIEAYDVVSFQ